MCVKIESNTRLIIDVKQDFENFIDAEKSGGGENLNGRMADLGILQSQTNNLLPGFMTSDPQEQPIQTRAALAFIYLIFKGIDAITREKLLQIMLLLGIGNISPVFVLVPTVGPFRTAALLPTITEEDKLI